MIGARTDGSSGVVGAGIGEQGRYSDDLSVFGGDGGARGAE